MIGLGLNMTSSATQDAGVNRVSPYSNEYSAVLDGVDDVIHLGLSDAQMDIIHGDSFSVSFWLRRKTWATSYLFGFNQATGNANSFWIRYLNIGSSYLQAEVKHNNTSHPALAAISAPASETWIHFAASVTKGVGGSNGSARYYINGSEVASSTASNGTNFDAADIASGFKYAVGAQQNAATPTFTGYTKGNYDEVAIWGTDLSANEITAIYNSGSTFDLTSDNGNYTSSSDLQYYYRLENDFSDTQGRGSDASNPSGGVTFIPSSSTPTP